MKTWPIAVHRAAERTFLGIPDRLGAGGSYRDLEAPSLEQVAGDGWSEELLGRLLPRRRPWAWWTRGAVVKQAGLPSTAAPRRIDLRTIAATCSRRFRLRGTGLVIVPPAATSDQELVLAWADQDTEEIPDHLWSAPDGLDEWNTDEIARWCSERAAWSDPSSLAGLPAERVLSMFDGYVFVALAPPATEEAVAALGALADRWGIAVGAGRPEYAWVSPPT
jgi:hypothetical protein